MLFWWMRGKSVAYALSSSPEWFTNELCPGYLKRWKCPLRPAASLLAKKHRRCTQRRYTDDWHRWCTQLAAGRMQSTHGLILHRRCTLERNPRERCHCLKIAIVVRDIKRLRFFFPRHLMTNYALWHNILLIPFFFKGIKTKPLRIYHRRLHNERFLWLNPWILVVADVLLPDVGN